MLRRTMRFLMEGERRYVFPGESPMGNTGGLPFYGNVYSGRVDSQNYVPPKQGGSTLLEGYKDLWEDPSVRSKIERCPYFALCDQVIWQNMDPAYLDPGVLTPEEHHLLLMHSCAYFEKWRIIHENPPAGTPRIRLRYGTTKVLDQILSMLRVPDDVCDSLKKEYMVDDASLIAMRPDLWTTAYLDPANMDQLSGRVLEFAGMPEHTRKKFFLVLKQMRRMIVSRRDTEGFQKGEGEERLVLPFSAGVTLFDLYKNLGLQPYSGQLKVYDYVDFQKTPRMETLHTEDAYFDFLVYCFYNPNFGNATLSEELLDDSDTTCRYTITAEPHTMAERRIGRWF